MDHAMKVLASCDSIYFLEHHEAFYYSALEQGLTPFINVVNPTKEVQNLVEKLENVDYSFYKGTPSRASLACNRFFIAEDYIEGGILITDIDCYFNKEMPHISEDIGLFLREEQAFTGMRVAAGILWLKGNTASRVFINAVTNNIRNLDRNWFVDQKAIYETYCKLKDDLSIFKFTNVHMDWEFTSESCIWTGKGSRKYKNKTYLERKREIENGNNKDI